MTDERITFDGEDLDEIVMTGTIHIERLDADEFMINIWTDVTHVVCLTGRDLDVTYHEGVDDLIKVGRSQMRITLEVVVNLIAAQAWERGFHDGKNYAADRYRSRPNVTVNPYTSEEPL